MDKALDNDAVTTGRKLEAEKAKIKTLHCSRHSSFGGSFVHQNIEYERQKYHCQQTSFCGFSTTISWSWSRKVLNRLTETISPQTFHYSQQQFDTTGTRTTLNLLYLIEIRWLLQGESRARKENRPMYKIHHSGPHGGDQGSREYSMSLSTGSCVCTWTCRSARISSVKITFRYKPDIL